MCCDLICTFPAEPNSLFTIWTKAFTSKHEGESSSPVVMKTDLSKPHAPLIVNLTCQSDSTLFLHWRRPAHFYGAVHLYYISYRPEAAYDFDEIVVTSTNNSVDHNVSSGRWLRGFRAAKSGLGSGAKGSYNDSNPQSGGSRLERITGHRALIGSSLTRRNRY